MVAILRGYIPLSIQYTPAWVFFLDNKTTIMCRLMYADDYPFDRIKKVVDAYRSADSMVAGEKTEGLYEAVKTSTAFVDDVVPEVSLSFNVGGVDVFIDSNGTEYCEYLDGEYSLSEEESVDIALTPSVLVGILKKDYTGLAVKCALGNKIALVVDNNETTTIVLVGTKD
jgi:hypothetical protein